MKIMGLDYGTKKIGLALTDGLGSMAFAKQTITYSNDEEGLGEVLCFAQSHRVEGIVIGIPYYRDGNISPVARKVYQFIHLLQARLDIPYFTMNEYLTSFEAKARLGKNRTKEDIDSYSAKIILEDFLALSIEQRLLHRV